MKKALYHLAFLCTTTAVKSQLYVQSGAKFPVGGTVTLLDEGFIQEHGGGTAISGNIGLLNQEIAKSGNQQVSLQIFNEVVTGQMLFTSGNVNFKK
ncbi:MAG: hypothetical protein KF825_10630 [Ferruginibacter sp.]|nr:hypothetical protein [Ferruginibacter sp.]